MSYPFHGQFQPAHIIHDMYTEHSQFNIFSHSNVVKSRKSSGHEKPFIRTRIFVFFHVLSIPLDRASTHVPHVYEEEYAQGIMHKAIILTTH